MFNQSSKRRNQVKACLTSTQLELLEDRRLLTGFAFHDFGDVAGLALLGDAGVTEDARLRLTEAARSQIGGVWNTETKPFVGVGFETSFEFSSTTSGTGRQGFAFVIQNDSPTALMASDHHLGYNQLPNSLGIELRPGDNTIRVQSRGVLPNNNRSDAYSFGTFDTSFINVNLEDGSPHVIRVSYLPGNLSIYLDDFDRPIIESNLNIADFLDLDFGRAWIGFTASTFRLSPATHDILSWHFEPLADVATAVGIESSAVAEGDSATTTIAFELSRLGATTATSTVTWSTTVGTAIPGTDYVADSGIVSFAPGESSKTISVDVINDVIEELHEHFFVELTDATGATIVAGRATGTIYNDEATLSIGDATAVEGDSSMQLIDVFTISPAEGGQKSGHGMTIGPDGNLYVASDWSNSIMRFDGTTGAFIDHFVGVNSGGLNNPQQLMFGPDENLYVSSALGDAILRYDGRTGEFTDVFVDTRAHGGDQTGSFVFAPDGYMYVAGGRSRNVLRFDAETGDFGGEFLSTDRGSLAIGPDGNLYVGSGGRDSVRRYDLSSGDYLGDFVADGAGGLSRTRMMLFRPDGYLYISGFSSNAIHRYDAATGEYVDDFIAPGQAGLQQPHGFAFDAHGNIFVVQQDIGNILRFGPASNAYAEVSLSAPLSVPVMVGYTTDDASATAGLDYTDSRGSLKFDGHVTSQKLVLSTIDDDALEPVEVFTVRLADAQGGTVDIADAIGEIEILDDVVIYAGDANRDGQIAFDDFLQLSSNYGKKVDAVWQDGDFSGDGKVDFEDFLLLSSNFGRGPI